MKKKSLNKIKQMMSIGMSCIMAGSTWSTWNLPTVLHAEEVHTESVQVEAKQEDAVHTGAAQPTYVITSFDELAEEIAYQTLPIGAEESEINFPDTLKVSVIRQVEEELATEVEEEKTTTEAEEETTTETEEETETTSEVLESQAEEESQTEVENETLESESETETPMTETQVPETAVLPEPQTQAPETTVSESEAESTEQLESDTTEEESSIVASLIGNIKSLFTPVEVYAAEEPLAYSADGGNSAKDSTEGEEWIIEHITWKLDVEKSALSEFDSSEESAGAVYFYTPTIPETDENGNHYILSEEAILPEISVMIDGVDNGIALYSNIVDSGTCGAEGNNGDNLTWTLDNEGVLTISGTGAMKDWNWKGSPWYKNKDIKSVMIEDGVTSIGAFAFGDCSSLTNIELSNSVTSIGLYAFYKCSGLTSITIPSSVTSIGDSAFSGCSGLTSITISNSVTSIRSYVFSGCSGLTSITIPSSVTSIGQGAFSECSGLTSITISNSVTSIGLFAFSKCSGLTSITIPNSVTSIGLYAFFKCSGLTSITIPNSVTSIGEGAFSGCSGLTRVIYLGTKEQWNNLTIESDNDYCLKAAKIFHVHTPANDFSFNATYHWYQCTDEACPVKNSPQAQSGCTLHNWEKGKCTECYYECKHTKLNFIPELKAKCVTDGNKAYYACEICDVIYWDEMGTNEITNRDDIKIAALGHKDVDKNHICDICNQTTDHTGGTATCIAKAVCTTCNQPYGEVDSSNHTGAEEWIQTEEKHEKKWSCCNLVTVKEEVHEWKDGVCEECKYVCQHKDDNSDHLCDICNKKVSDHIGGTATCTEKAVCTTCNQPYGEVDSSNHTGKEEWIQTEEKHKKKWSCCDLVTVKEEVHEWKDGVCEECKYVCQHKDDNSDHLCDICNKKVSDHTGGTATCTEKAVCTICNQLYGEVNSSNHTGKEEWIQTEEKHEKKWNCCDLVTVKEEIHEWKGGACEECGYACQHKDVDKNHLCDTCGEAMGIHEAAQGKHTCDYCNKVVSDHTGGTATCKDLAICDVCGQPYGEVNSSNHTGAEEWIQTEETHEKKWNCCDLVTVAEEVHEWKDGVCEECGYACQHKDVDKNHLCDTCGEAMGIHEAAQGKHTCDYCNKVVSDHTGGTATCKDLAICDVCGEPYGKLDSNNHAGGRQIRNAEEATCTKEGYTGDIYCNGCGDKLSSGSVTKSLGHKDVNKDHFCDVCNTKISEHIGGIATCIAKAVCTECGMEYGEIDSQNHDILHHESKAATCTQIGWEAYDTCKREGCNYTTYVELPALKHDLKHHEAKVATCTEIGWEAYDTCKREGCNYTTYVELPALKHDLEHHAAKAATCTEIGWEAYDTCKREGCNYSTYVELPALKHDLEHHAAKAPTCTEIGWEAYDTCKREGCEYTTYKELPALDHDLEHHEAKVATCTEIGWEAYDTCKREGCDYTTYVELPALKHDLEHHEVKVATCTEIGWEAYDTCKREGCNYSTYVELPALKHDLEHHKAKAATCTEIGWKEYDTCKREGCEYTTYQELAALDHDLKHHEAKAATCTEIGWDAYDTCKREGCDYTTYKQLAALGHKDNNNDHLCDACSTKISDHSYESKITREATTTDTGIRTYTCTRCGHSYTEELAKLPSQTNEVNQSNQADQTNSVESANNGNKKDFIGTVTSVFLNTTDVVVKNFTVSIWLLIQMFIKALLQFR